MELNIQLINLAHIIDRSSLTTRPDSYVADAIVLINQKRSDSLAPSYSNLSLPSQILVVEAEKLLGIFTTTDVVKLIAAKEVAELERQRYQDLFEFAPDGYIVIDTLGVIQEANQAATNLLSTEQKLLVGKPLAMFVALQDRQILISQLHNLQQWETSLYPANSPPFPATIKVTAINDCQGQHIGWRCLISNISGSKQAEEVLEKRVQVCTAELLAEINECRHSEKLYRDLVESQIDLVVRINLQGGITFANTATRKTLGCHDGQLLFEFFHPEDLPAIIENITAITSPPYQLSIDEQRVLTVEGVRYFQWNFTAIRHERGEVTELQGVGIDITNRKQMEQALREREEKFRHFADNNQALIWITDPESGENLYVNPAYEKIWGCSSRVETIHPEDRNPLMAALEEQKQGNSTDIEYRILQPDGSVRWIWERGFVIRDEQGKVNSYGGVAEDITAWKYAENSLRESEARLTLALTSVQIGIWDWNIPTQDILWSANMGPLYGLPSGSKCPPYPALLDLIHPEDREALIRKVRQVIVQKTECVIDYRVIHPDGSIHWLSSRGQVYDNEMGVPIRMIGTTRDIADRKLAEEKIREQADLLDITTDAIFVRDFQNQILFWNKGAERLYGWQAQETLGINPNQLFYPQTSLHQEEIAVKTVVELGSWQGELHKFTKSGREVIVESRWTLVCDAVGKPESILTVDTDITEKKQLQSEFFRAQRLESLGTLAGGIAHDLNNILTPIMASAQILKLKSAPLEERHQQLLSIIENNAKHGAALVKQVLSFARGFKGELTIVQVKYLIGEIIQIAKQTFPKSIQFSTQIAEDLWAVSGDATQLHQVLMNLVVNARDAMPEGGTLTIEAKNLFIDEAYTRMNLNAKVGTSIVITVSDTGIGMSPEILDRIFEPFFTTKDMSSGTGLGLSTVLGIIKSHNGFVDVSSQVGKGSQFKLFLPSLEVAQDASKEPLELPQGQGELILVVEDEATICEITTLILENHNYQTITAKNGIEAIALYAEYKERISVILMDLIMPEMDGMTAIRTLQKMNPQVQIIACSGLNSTDMLSPSAFTQVQAVLSKPYTAKDLLEKLSCVLRG